MANATHIYAKLYFNIMYGTKYNYIQDHVHLEILVSLLVLDAVV